jgi:hypothetical protein
MACDSPNYSEVAPHNRVASNIIVRQTRKRQGIEWQGILRETILFRRGSGQTIGKDPRHGPFKRFKEEISRVQTGMLKKISSRHEVEEWVRERADQEGGRRG